ncbi:MAG: acetyl-CoA carboxylase biotin carboxylase subunit [Caldilineaceae bacterium]
MASSECELFSKILVANRGEIAVRIIRACQELGIRTVAVYSAADATAPHVWLADEAAALGPAPAVESYLRIDKLIDVATRYGCDAVHPGYGFLAENADFAAAVIAAGLTWIGPAPATIRAMGSKTAARRTMQAAGVPVVPGYQAGGTDAELMAAAQDLGYPLLVKAAAGGGGKGMRTVQAAPELPAALESARHEARHAFGDDEIFLEKLVAQPHHVEFQILGDQHGNLVHLFERECSIQRRHQKIIEESPSPLLNQILSDKMLRQRMGEAAVAAARAVDYVNAGTVEFLVDEQGNFYFLEMNTRLQVEHPITELVTGVDLVQTQIQVAAGAPLPFTQADLHQRGHAIECRIYAEDAANGFAPSIGALHLVKEPTGPGIRVDSGVTSGDTISHHYDPLLAKLIVLGADRQQAIQRMLYALQHYVILGEVVTNLTFLQAVLAHPAFAAGATSTAFLEQHLPHWTPPATPPPDAVLIAAALADWLGQATPVATALDQAGADPYNPWAVSNGFRLGHEKR